MLTVNKIVKEIRKYPNVVGVILFGSFTKKKFGPMSDIDIAVIVKNHDKKTEAEIGSMYSDLFDISLFHRLPLYIQFEVLKDGKIIFMRDKKYFSAVKRNVLKEYLEMSYIYEKMNKKVLA